MVNVRFCESKAILKASFFSKLEVMIDSPRNNPLYVTPWIYPSVIGQEWKSIISALKRVRQEDCCQFALPMAIIEQSVPGQHEIYCEIFFFRKQKIKHITFILFTFFSRQDLVQLRLTLAFSSYQFHLPWSVSPGSALVLLKGVNSFQRVPHTLCLCSNAFGAILYF